MPVFNRSSDQRIESRKAWKTARISGRDANTNRRGYVQFYEEFCAHWRSCVDIRPFSLSGRQHPRLHERQITGGDTGDQRRVKSVSSCKPNVARDRQRRGWRRAGDSHILTALQHCNRI